MSLIKHQSRKCTMKRRTKITDNKVSYNKRQISCQHTRFVFHSVYYIFTTVNQQLKVCKWQFLFFLCSKTVIQVPNILLRDFNPTGLLHVVHCERKHFVIWTCEGMMTIISKHFPCHTNLILTFFIKLIFLHLLFTVPPE